MVRCKNSSTLMSHMGYVGMHQDEIARKGWALSAADAIALRGRPDIAIVDRHEKSEREKHGVTPGSLHAPYPSLQEEVGVGGMLHELAATSGKRMPWRCRRRTRRRPQNRLPYRWRHRRLEESGRTADALTAAALSAAPIFGLSTLSAAERYVDRASAPSSLADTASWHHRRLLSPR